MIFVDETLIQIDGGQDYWLWIAYEPNIDLCSMVDTYVSQDKELCSHVISSSRNYERYLAENSYLQQCIMMLVSG
jgi:hypothetical protein